jgi:hypothetical protein
VNEIVTSEHAKCLCGVEAERIRGSTRCLAARRRRGSELAQDPEVELSLAAREATQPRHTLTLRANLGRTEGGERSNVAFRAASVPKTRQESP